MVKERNVVLVYLFSIITLGIYGIYWIISTKNEFNKLGAEIPTAFLLIVPIVNIYWVYKYCEGYSNHVRKDNNAILWFVVYIFAGFLIPAFVQIELNKLA